MPFAMKYAPINPVIIAYFFLAKETLNIPPIVWMIMETILLAIDKAPFTTFAGRTPARKVMTSSPNSSYVYQI
jgi:hypothetical protein